jgi:hypothetical protein
VAAEEGLVEATQCVLTGGGFPWEVAAVKRDAYNRRAVPEKEDPPVADAEFGDAVRVPDVQVALRKRPTGSSGLRGVREVLPGDDHGSGGYYFRFMSSRIFAALKGDIGVDCAAACEAVPGVDYAVP